MADQQGHWTGEPEPTDYDYASGFSEEYAGETEIYPTYYEAPASSELSQFSTLEDSPGNNLFPFLPALGEDKETEQPLAYAMCVACAILTLVLVFAAVFVLTVSTGVLSGGKSHGGGGGDAEADEDDPIYAFGPPSAATTTTEETTTPIRTLRTTSTAVVTATATTASTRIASATTSSAVRVSTRTATAPTATAPTATAATRIASTTTARTTTAPTKIASTTTASTRIASTTTARTTTASTRIAPTTTASTTTSSTSPSTAATPPGTSATGATTTMAGGSTASTRRPKLPLRQKLLVCTTSSTSSQTMPPKDLCDFLLYDTSNDGSSPFSATLGGEVRSFARNTYSPAKTRFGVWISETQRTESYNMLVAGEGENWVRQLWGMNLRTYALLDIELSINTTSAQVSETIDMFQKINTLISAVEASTPDGNGYIILGIITLYKTSASQQMSVHFDQLVRDIKPDALVFVTTYLREFITREPRCRIVGPSAWKDATIVDQPTFVDTLTFRATLTLPPYMPELLSLDISGRWAYFHQSQVRTRWQGIGVAEICTQMSRLAYQNKACPKGRQYDAYHKYPDPMWTDTERQQKYGRTAQWDWILAYDTNGTMATKMCWASKTYNFDGGWTVFDLQNSDVQHYCPDNVHTDGFRLVNWVKFHMQNGFTDCNNIGSKTDDW